MQDYLANLLNDIEQGDGEWPTMDVALDSENASLVLALPEHGDLAVTVTFKGDEWLVMADVAPVSAVSSEDAFNKDLLRLGIAIPLVSVGIMSIDGEEHYVIYGQLFADCKFAAIREEVQACAKAAIEVAELISDAA